VADVVGQGTANAAVWTDGVDRRRLRARHQRQGERLVRQRPGRTGRSALAARDAGTLSHGLVEVKGDARCPAAVGAADDLVRLDLVTSANAAITKDAGIVVDGDHTRAVVDRTGRPLLEPTVRQTIAAGEGLQFAVAGGPLADARRGMLSQQQFQQDATASLDTRVGRLDLHIFFAGPDAGSSQHAAADVDDAQAADADRPQSWLMAQHRD